MLRFQRKILDTQHFLTNNRIPTWECSMLETNHLIIPHWLNLNNINRFLSIYILSKITKIMKKTDLLNIKLPIQIDRNWISTIIRIRMNVWIITSRLQSCDCSRYKGYDKINIPFRKPFEGGKKSLRQSFNPISKIISLSLHRCSAWRGFNLRTHSSPPLLSVAERETFVVRLKASLA